MAQRKSIAQQLLEAQQRRAKEKAAREKADREAAEKADAAAAKEAAAQARQAQRAAEELAKRKQSADARAVAQVIRDMNRRDQLREAKEAQDAAREAREKERQALADARQAKLQAVDELRQEAADRTDVSNKKIDALGRILSDRDRDLEYLREHTDAAFEHGDAEAFGASVAEVLARLENLHRARVPVQVAYTPDNRQLTLRIDLPRKEMVPVDREFRYVPARREIVAEQRKPAEIQKIYQDAIARFTLCVADYAAAVTSPELVESIAINGHVRTKDPATGQPANPCLVTFLATREMFAQLLLDEPRLDPVRCLHHLRARVSPNPFDLEAVTPIVDFDLQRFKLVEDAAALTGLDSRIDLLSLSPYEFEQLIKHLFVAMGYKSWRTQNSKDGGIDAIAYREDIALGGLCVIQAKRYKDTVPVEAVRAMGGTMMEKKAFGMVVTTSSFGPASHAYAAEVGRLALIDGRHLKALLRQYLDMDVLISLPKLPPGWKASDIGPDQPGA
ncbi:MAG TPA: restriction endonuclease [Actinocrinis sp.]|nr:restriction endonuclease [Actinocrinis sp.]